MGAEKCQKTNLEEIKPSALRATRQKVWVNQGDIVLVSLRDFQDEKGDIIVKYTADEARNLKTYNELPEGVKINETDIVDGELSDDGVEFDEGAGVDIDAI